MSYGGQVGRRGGGSGGPEAKERPGARRAGSGECREAVAVSRDVGLTDRRLGGGPGRTGRLRREGPLDARPRPRLLSGCARCCACPVRGAASGSRQAQAQARPRRPVVFCGGLRSAASHRSRLSVQERSVTRSPQGFSVWLSRTPRTPLSKQWSRSPAGPQRVSGAVGIRTGPKAVRGTGRSPGVQRRAVYGARSPVTASRLLTSFSGCLLVV